MKIHVIMAAGGSGVRMGAGINKVFLELQGIPILKRSILLFDGLADSMTVVCREADMPEAKKIASGCKVSFPVIFTAGGKTRQESVMNGLKTLQDSGDDIVLIHDAARCLTPAEVICRVIDSCKRYGSGIPAVPAVNTMKYSEDEHTVTCTVNRSGLYEIQTPQGFRMESFVRASIRAVKDRYSVTDDASVMEHSGEKVYIVRGAKMNIKITEKEDLTIAAAMLSGGLPSYRIGSGYDVHRLTENRKLILCGVEIPYQLGLLGHSDADVALHALMDAMLGAASLGDIGTHFPDNDDAYRGISSKLLLKETVRKIKSAGYRFVNSDITIVAQKPKIARFIPEMICNVCSVLECTEDQINIKATTTEMLGFEGRGEGISAQAVCMLCRIT